jgi:hypothetical protein
MKNQFCFTAVVMLLTALNCSGQKQGDSDKELQKRYTVVNRVISQGKDAGSIHLNDAEGVGIAWVNNKEFTFGTIEFDVKGKDELQASFLGIAFHGADNATYESVYFRPFNFRADDPARKSHAVQYMAIPEYDWSKLRTEFPGKYEQPITPAPDPNAWFHVRIKVEPKTISVYVNSNKTPSLVVQPLVPVRGKMIGYWSGGTDSEWKNLKITATGD